MEEILNNIPVLSSNIIIEYLIRAQLLTKQKLYLFYLFKGFDMLITIFSLSLCQSKNIDVTFYKCQNAIHLYIEYVQQISNEQNSFLQLTSRDALLYVYKQTILDDIKINETNDAEPIFKIILLYTNIFKKILEIFLTSSKNEEKKYILDIQEIKVVYENICQTTIEKKNIIILEKIVDLLQMLEIDLPTFIKMWQILLKKTKEKKEYLLKIKKKIFTENYCENLSEIITYIQEI
jgi:hypothetical protein